MNKRSLYQLSFAAENLARQACTVQTMHSMTTSYTAEAHSGVLSMNERWLDDRITALKAAIAEYEKGE